MKQLAQWSLVLLVVGMLSLPTCSQATSLESKVGVTLTEGTEASSTTDTSSTSSSQAKTDPTPKGPVGKVVSFLPRTGEARRQLMSWLGGGLLLVVLWISWHRRKGGEAHEDRQ